MQKKIEKDKGLLIVAVIPARGGSKGVKNKNIKEIAEQPLISYSILDALQVPEINEVYVSSDSVKIGKISEKYGATFVLRPPEYAKDDSLDEEWVLHFFDWYRINYGTYPDYIVHLRATTPIRDISIISQAINIFINDEESTSLRSVELFPESPYKWVTIQNGYFKSLYDNDEKAHMKPRQNYPKVYKPNGYVDIYKKEQILSLKDDLVGDKILAFIAPMSIEIDNEETFQMAKTLIEAKL